MDSLSSARSAIPCESVKRVFTSFVIRFMDFIFLFQESTTYSIELSPDSSSLVGVLNLASTHTLSISHIALQAIVFTSFVIRSIDLILWFHESETYSMLLFLSSASQEIVFR